MKNPKNTDDEQTSGYTFDCDSTFQGYYNIEIEIYFKKKKIKFNLLNNLKDGSMILTINGDASTERKLPKDRLRYCYIYFKKIF